jgi:hypothetical protein
MLASVLAVLLLLAVAPVMAQDAGPDGRPSFPSPGDNCAHLGRAFAQLNDDSGPPMGGQRGGRWGFGENADERRKHLEQFRMFEMLKLLDLSSDQEVGFLTAFKNWRTETQELEGRRRAYLDSLRAALDDDGGDANLEKYMTAVQTVHRDMLRIADEFMDSQRNVLTARQRAKLVLFHEEFEFQLLRKLKDYRDRMGGGGMGPGGPGGRQGP